MPEDNTSISPFYGFVLVRKDVGLLMLNPPFLLQLLWVSPNYPEHLPTHPSLHIASHFPPFWLKPFKVGLNDAHTVNHDLHNHVTLRHCPIYLYRSWPHFAVKPQSDISYISVDKTGPTLELPVFLTSRCLICLLGAAAAPALRSIWCPLLGMFF